MKFLISPDSKSDCAACVVVANGPYLGTNERLRKTTSSALSELPDGLAHPVLQFNAPPAFHFTRSRRQAVASRRAAFAVSRRSSHDLVPQSATFPAIWSFPTRAARNATQPSHPPRSRRSFPTASREIDPPRHQRSRRDGGPTPGRSPASASASVFDLAYYNIMFLPYCSLYCYCGSLI